MIEIGDIITEMNTHRPSQPGHTPLEYPHGQSHFQRLLDTERFHTYAATDTDR